MSRKNKPEKQKKLKKQKKQNTQTRTFAWGWVIAALVFMPPLGFFLLFQIMQGEAKDRIKNSLIVMIPGLLMTFLGLGNMVTNYLGSWQSMAAYRRSLGAPLFFLTFGILFFAIGLFYLLLGLRERRCLRLIRQEQIYSLDDLCLIDGTSLPELCDQLEKLKENGLLDDTTISYPQRSLTQYDSADPLFSLSVSTGGFSAPPEKEKSRRDIPSILWVVGAVVSVISGVFYLPLGIILTVAALVLELRLRPRHNRIIFRCAICSFGFIVFMFSTVGLFTLTESTSHTPPQLYAIIYLPCCILTLLDLIAYRYLTFRARRYGRATFLQQTDSSLDSRQISAFCGRTFPADA